MAKRHLEELGELQRRVLEILWKRGEGTVHDVRAELAKKSDKEPAYTTVLTILQKLTAGGWVTARGEGRRNIYTPVRGREEAGAASLSRFLKSVFRGNAKALMQNLIEEEKLSDEELDELQQLIKERRAKRGKTR